MHAYDKAILKFDISCDYKSHYHVAPNHAKRHTLIGDNNSKLVQEIKTVSNSNLQQWLMKHPHPNISSLQLDSTLFRTAMNQACDVIQFYLDNLDSLIEDNHRD